MVDEMQNILTICTIHISAIGTRYNTRGIDDSGNVANFVETETILSNSEWCFAYTQIRGSVPGIDPRFQRFRAQVARFRTRNADPSSYSIFSSILGATRAPTC